MLGEPLAYRRGLSVLTDLDIVVEDTVFVEQLCGVLIPKPNAGVLPEGRGSRIVSTGFLVFLDLKDVDALVMIHVVGKDISGLAVCAAHRLEDNVLPLET